MWLSRVRPVDIPGRVYNATLRRDVRPSHSVKSTCWKPNFLNEQEITHHAKLIVNCRIRKRVELYQNAKLYPGSKTTLEEISYSLQLEEGYRIFD